MNFAHKVKSSLQGPEGAVRVSGGRAADGRRIGMRTIVIALGLSALLAFIAWQVFGGTSLPDGIVGGNGRLEANELYVATKYPGRVKDVLVDEGETVDAGETVARMDTEALEAQLREALAKLKEAQDSRAVAVADIATKGALADARRSDVAVKEADHTYATLQYRRSKALVGGGAVSEQEAEIDSARMLSTRAQVAGARADLVGSRADLTGSRAQAQRAVSAIEAARAEVDRLRAEIRDAVLVAPIRARVDTRLAEPGEVLPAGGRVFSLLDLSDVYMYVFLPERVVGKIALGSDARIVLDSAPGFPIRAYVAFVSPTAQFTPKTVETAEERHNLTFRVKLQLYKERLREYESLVKAGLPGMGYVRFAKGVEWPAKLQFKNTPPNNLWMPTGRQGAR